MTLHTFTTPVPHSLTNSDGAQPYAGLILSGNTLYGTAEYGGTNAAGTVFAVSTAGTNFMTLHSFTQTLGPSLVNSDGAYPIAGLVLSSNTLYGTAYNGGTNGGGTVFSVSTTGSDFMTLHGFTVHNGPGFTNSDGALPQSGLILSGNTLYGTASEGGTNGSGTVFALNTDGTDFTNLYTFNGATNGGDRPLAGLILSSNTLYGTTYLGSANGNGMVFSLSVASVGVVAPQLTFNRSGAQLIFTWPTNATSVALQSITSLSSGTWSNVISGITTVGANYVFTNTANGSAAFFRLNQP
jgi:uncharacterized repeat protein (TIGR03803 family)